MTILHGVPASPYVRKVQAVLELKSVEYSVNPIIPFGDKTELTAINPLAKIPAFEDADVTLGDSKVICAYLEKRYPDVAVLPSDTFDYAKTLWLQEYADSQLTPLLGRVFFQRVLNPKFFDTPTDDAVVTETINEHLPAVFDYLETQLGDQAFFVSNTLTLADIAIASPFVNAACANFTVDETQWPHLAAFVSRMFAESWFNNKIEL